MNAMNSSKGFTLVELMAVLAIIGILARFAYPNYVSNVQTTRRADAKGALLGLANAMERFNTQNNTYIGAAGTQASPTTTGSPWIFSTQAPVDGSTKYYNLTISAATVSTFTVQAAPISTSAQSGDKCGTLTLTNAGLRGISSAASGVQASDCW